ncbi:hypothetical protein [Pseudomonas sp. Marseille-Q5115]|uniref:hypothetical protein n=1 Tax=Pseudomonas sp. Marseille-Q5115 TaxID=2866593 RepID=UPI001CE4335D|nr:hypothetical protein [Pseudomonas sp. Marseille-Q5115]
MSASVAWALLATRASGACLLLLMYGWPAVSGWYWILDTSSAPMALSNALALSLGLFTSAVCPSLVALGVWPRWAAATVVGWLGALLACGEAHLSAATLLVLFAVLAFTGAGPFTLPTALGRRRQVGNLPSAATQRQRATATARH